MTLLDELQNELRSLKQNLINIDHALDSSPEGSLRLSPGKNGKTYFYIQYCNSSGKTRYDYISTRKHKTICTFAQKGYLKKLRPIIQAECERLEAFLEGYDPLAKGQVYSLLSPARQAFVTPIYLSVQNIVENWNTEHYEKLRDRPWELKHITDRGDLVRTSSEAHLANFFHNNRHRLLYRYEAALPLFDDCICYPTFTLISLETGKKYHWEHVSVSNGSQCLNEFIRKINMYVRAGYYPGENLIITFESFEMPLNMQVVRQLVLKLFPYRF